jgi:hypothetical protein
MNPNEGTLPVLWASWFCAYDSIGCLCRSDGLPVQTLKSAACGLQTHQDRLQFTAALYPPHRPPGAVRDAIK